MTDWKRKLLAFLHDPPEKAYDYSPEHGKRAQLYAARIDLDLSEWKDKLADHTAAAADRFIFPATKREQDGHWADTGVQGLGGGLQFIHPLAGGKVRQTPGLRVRSGLSSVNQQVNPALSRPAAEDSPVRMVQLATDDPNVVIYWLFEEKGEER